MTAPAAPAMPLPVRRQLFERLVREEVARLGASAQPQQPPKEAKTSPDRRGGK